MNFKSWTVASSPKGTPKLTKIVEESVPSLEDGEIFCKAEWLTVDPYMRGRMESSVRQQMVGEQIARIIESRCPEFPEGILVLGYFGWRDLTVKKVPQRSNKDLVPFTKSQISKDPIFRTLWDHVECQGETVDTFTSHNPQTLFVRNSPYFGLTRLCDLNPKKPLSFLQLLVPWEVLLAKILCNPSAHDWPEFYSLTKKIVQNLQHFPNYYFPYRE